MKIRALVFVGIISLAVYAVASQAHPTEVTITLAGTYVNAQGETMCRYNNGVEIIAADGRCIPQVTLILTKKIAE